MKAPRKYKRNTYSNKVTFAMDGIEYHGFSENISAGGIFIKTDKSFSIGEAIELTFPLSNKKKQVKFHAEIIRSTDDGIGVKFMK